MTDLAASKIACIGGGYWGKNLIRNFNDLDALSWVCEIDPTMRDQLKQKYPSVRFTESVYQVLADSTVAGVVIATPAVTHADLVRRALLADKDVFVEKTALLIGRRGKKTSRVGV